VFQALLDAGCCLDQSIPIGETFLSILNGQQKSNHVSKFRFHHYLGPLVNVIPLACACAKVIRRNRIAFQGRLPPRLQSFVSRHSTVEGEIVIHTG
jgi:Na+/H+ antiporter NhaC